MIALLAQTPWVLVWQVVLLASLIAFAVLAVVVTIAGARELPRLFSGLGKDGDESGDAPNSRDT